MSLATLLRQPITIRRRIPGGPDAHGMPTITEQTVATTGHVQARSGTSSQAAGVGEIASRRATLFVGAGTAIDVGDVVDDGVDEWVVIVPPRVSSRPQQPGIHHVAVDVAWSAPAPTRPVAPGVGPSLDDQWDTLEW